MTPEPAPVVEPRPASTVAILRDGDGAGAGGPDVWLMRRHSAMAFAPGMQAFPGGSVEPVDHDEVLPWSVRPDGATAAALGVDVSVAAALVSAAVRETFEECGVLIADGPAPEPALFEQARLALLDLSRGWADVLSGGGFALDSTRLRPWSRWITPSWSPRRFDAYFFVAALPDGQRPRWIDGEADGAQWWNARAAVAAHDRGDLPMLPPTIETLCAIATGATVADVLAAAPDRIETHDG
jgi:8-oxo-dGTP pyrophosphatase MutT (NUDIX family)